MKTKIINGETYVLNGKRWRLGVERTCKYCGNIFYATIYSVRKGEGNFCSRACNIRNLPINRENFGRKARKVCAVCKKSFLVRQYRKDRYKTCGDDYCKRTLRSRLSRRRWKINPVKTPKGSDGKYMKV